MSFVERDFKNVCIDKCKNKTANATKHNAHGSNKLLDDLADIGTQLSAGGKYSHYVHPVNKATRQKESYKAFRNIWIGHISVVCNVFLMTLMKRMNYYTVA